MSDDAATATRAATVYLDRRVIIVTVLGFASGLPLALTGSTLALWMAEAGVDLATIGLFSLVGLPYVVKFAWAPVVDSVRLPVLTHWLGRRRGWIVAVQAALVAAIAGVGCLGPAAGAETLAAAALAVAVLSATQDIVIDAFRVEFLDEERYAAGMAGFVAAYRVALVVAGAGTVFLVTGFEHAGAAEGAAWAAGYALTGAMLFAGTVAVLAAEEPDTTGKTAAMASPTAGKRLASRVAAILIEPFLSFMRRPNWLLLLLFVAVFKLGDALAAALLGPFALDLGFDKETIAAVTKGVGLAAVLAGGFVGGLLGTMVPMSTGLWIAGLAQMVSNLAFTALALIGHATWALTAAIAIEAFCGGVGTVLFVAFLSMLCSDRAHTATQYALLSALSALGRTLFSATAGYLAIAVGWAAFFALTAVAAVPGLMLLWWLAGRGVLASPDPAPPGHG